MMHYGHKRMIFEKDVAIQVRDGTVLYANVFRPSEDGSYPVVVSFDVYGKDSIHVAAAMPAGGAYTLGQYAASAMRRGRRLIPRAAPSCEMSVSYDSATPNT